MSRIKPVFGTALDLGNPLNRGLVLEYALNENGGIVARDQSNHIGKGVFQNGPTWGVGEQGIHLNLVASSGQFIQAAHNPTWPFAVASPQLVAVSVQCIVWLNSLKNYNILFSNAGTGGFTYVIYVDSSGNLNAAVSSLQTITASGVITANKWLNIIVTYHVNSANGGVCYQLVNGLTVTNATSDSIFSGEQTYPISIGQNTVIGTTSNLDGKIALARMWNRAIRPPELQELSADPWSIYRVPKMVFGFNLSPAALTLNVSDTLALSDAVSLFSAALQFSDGFFLVDSVKLNLNIPLSVSDTLSLSDSLAWMFLGPFLGFALGDSFALSDSVALSHGISLSVSDAISLSDATLRSVFYNLQFVDTLNLTDAMGFNALMLGKIKEVDVLSLTDSIKLALTGSKSIQDTITLSDTVRIIMTGLASFADTLSLSDAVTRTVNSNDLVSDALALSDSVQLQLNVVPSNSYVDIQTLSDAVVVELYYFPPQLFIDTLQFTDSVNLVSETLGQFTDMLWFTDDVQLSLNVSTTSYLRLYLNDVIGSGNP